MKIKYVVILFVTILLMSCSEQGIKYPTNLPEADRVEAIETDGVIASVHYDDEGKTFRITNSKMGTLVRECMAHRK